MKKEDLKYSYNFLLEYKKAIDESSIVSKTDKNGLITFVNKKFCEVSGYEEHDGQYFTQAELNAFLALPSSVT